MRNFLLSLLCLLVTSASLMAQSRISGNITDEGGEALIGVNVLEAGTANGTITDFDGNYEITIKDGASLEFSYTGYENQTVAVGNQTTIDMVMSEGVNLDEVVVTALGIERKKRALAYSVTELGGDEVATAKEINVGNSLAGKVAGVNVSNPSTGPGGSTRIVIRGNGNIAGNNQPLIVVDGVPINNDNLGSAGMWGGQDWGDGLSSLNSDDIENISILKGNTASALYGYRASNGVILVTTKTGKKGQGLQVEFNSNFLAETFQDNYDFQTEYGHGRNGAKPTTQEEAFAQGLYAWGAKLDGSSVMQFDGQSRPYSNVGSNLDRFYRTGSTWTNNVSLSGGGENVGYRFSMTNLDNQGIMQNSGLDRNTFSASVNGQSGKWLGSLSGTYVKENTKNRPGLSDSPGNANYTAWSLPSSININDLKGDPNKLGADPATGFELQFNDNVFVTNPWWATHQFARNNEKDRLYGNASLGYEFIEGLVLRGKVGIDRFTERRTSLEPYGTAFTNFGAINESNRTVQEVNLEATLRFNRDITETVGLDVIVGGNQQKNFDESLGGRGANFNVPFLHSIKNGANQSVNYGFSQYQVNSLFGQAEVSLMNSLYLTATVRQDWFSQLTDPSGRDSENSILYSSFGVAYDLSEGLGDALPAFFDFAKVRASWAEVGGATDPYKLGLTYGIRGEGHLGNPLGSINNGSVPASALVPSTSRELEFGVDLRMYKGRVGLDIAYYNRETVDGILSASISSTSGYGSKTVNVGKISNKGVEVLLSLNPVRTSNFRWNLDINYARNNNKVVSLLTPEDDGEEIRLEESRTRNAYVHLVEGLPYSQVMGFAYVRDGSGNITLDDNGLPQQGDLMAFGTGVHPNSLGINNKFNIGDVRVSFLIDIKTGGKIYNATNAYGMFRGLHKATLEGRESGIGAVAAENIEDYYQRIAFGISEEFIDDADFAKLREVVIGYALPKRFLENVPVSGVTLSFAARNLFVLWKKTDNIDPESTYTSGNGQGLEMFGVPVTRTYGLNLNVKF
ncbi:MAG: SusC/RagA family TonB-linked outer membrane protein [Saprospiraceae bacterium]